MENISKLIHFMLLSITGVNVDVDVNVAATSAVDKNKL